MKLKKININNDFKEFIKDIERDVESFMKDENDEDFLKNKYLIDKDIKNYLNEFNYDYRGYYFPDEIEYFNYFNNMCIWNILVNLLNENWNIIFETYFNNLNIIKNSKLNYTEKTTLLITLIRRTLETKNGTEPQIFPRIIIFDQVNEIDKCYKEAYEFHLKLIDSLTEDSILIQPFLQLDSYIMEMILTDNDINLIKAAQKNKIQILDLSDKEKEELIKKVETKELVTQTAYTISMISIDNIKKHLKSTMRPYCLVFGKDGIGDYCGSVYKDNNIICFNEDKIFEELSASNLNNIKYRNKRKNDFTFIIHFFYLHENSCHNKEKIINIKVNSPIIFLDEDLKTSFIICDKNVNIGEAGYFLEFFIGNRITIFNLINSINRFGDLLDVNYFNKEDFNDLINACNSRLTEDKNNVLVNEGDKVKQFSLFKKKIKKEIINKTKIKLDSFGFSQHDIFLFEEARKKNCFY